MVLAGVTDWLDGFAARKLRSTGKLGVILDPVADKVMLVTLFLALGEVGLIKTWLVVLVIGRDLVIVLGALLVRSLRHVRQFPPSTLGKVSTFFQIVFVVTVLLYASFPYQFLLWLADYGSGSHRPIYCTQRTRLCPNGDSFRPADPGFGDSLARNVPDFCWYPQRLREAH